MGMSLSRMVMTVAGRRGQRGRDSRSLSYYAHRQFHLLRGASRRRFGYAGVLHRDRDRCLSACFCRSGHDWIYLPG